MALALSAGAFATAQEALTIPDGTGFVDAFGDVDNQKLTFTAGATYIMTNTVSVNAGVLTEVATGTFASEARIRFRNNGIPFLFSDLQLSTVGDYTGTSTLTAGTRTMTGTLAGFQVNSGSTWELEFADSVSDGTAGLVEQTIAGLVINTTAGPTPPATQQSITVSGVTPFIDAAADTSNTIITVANTAPAMALGNQIVLSAGTWRSLVAATTGDHARVRIRHSSSTAFADFRMVEGLTSDVGVGNDVSIAASLGRVTPLSGTLVGGIIPAGGNWTFEFHEFTQNGAADIAESQVTDLGFGLVGSPLPSSKFNWSNAGTLNSADDARQPTNSTDTPAATVATSFILGPDVLVNGGTLTEVDTTVFGSDLLIRVSNSAHPGKYAEFRPTIATSYTTSSPLTAALRSMRGTLVGHTMPAGSSFSFELVHDGGSVDTDRNDGLVEQTVTNINVDLTEGPAFVPGAAPSAVDLGAINISGSPFTLTSGAFTAGEVKWFKFTVPDVESGGLFVDILTELITSGLSDTEIGLWTANGQLLNEDDDDDTGFRSALSFGDLGPRAGTGTDGRPFNGRDGILKAGTYYISLCGFSATYGSAPFAITSNAASNAIGTTLIVRTNIPAPLPATLSGTVTLEDSDADWSDETVAITITDGTITENLTATLSASGAYSVNLPNTIVPGTYDVFIKGDTFLRKLTGAVSFTSTGAVVNATLMNGDVNGDNEVGPADFSDLAAAFGTFAGDPGYTEAADLNDDGEVGPADFAILAGNFGEFGD